MESDVQSANAAPENGLTRASLATHLVIPEAHPAALGMVDVYAGHPSVRVAYYGPTGTEIAARLFVSLTDPRANLWIGKSKPKPEGLDRLSDARKSGRLALVVGEPSAWVLTFHGEPVLALPSLDVWDDHRYAPLLASIPRINLVVTDQDRDDLLARFSRSRLR